MTTSPHFLPSPNAPAPPNAEADRPARARRPPPGSPIRTWTFAGDLDAPRRARHALLRWLAQQGWHEAQADEALLVLSELASNAVRHAAGGFELYAALAPDLRLEVTDAAPDRSPEVRAASAPWGDGSPPGEGGLGMVIVASVAKRWGVRTAPDHKVVWCDLAAPDPSTRGRQP